MTKRLSRVLPVLAAAVLLLAGAQAPPQDSEHAPVGILEGSALDRLKVTRADLRTAEPNPSIRYNGIARFLDRMRTVVTGTLDDSTNAMPKAIDAMDTYGIKATIAVSTQGNVIEQLWPRLRAAVDNGHEIGSHSRRHQCQWPDTEAFCRAAYSRDEMEGSRDDILAHTSQRYVWTWVYPCGNCAGYELIHRRLNLAGYLVARNYPDETHGGHLVPDLQSWAADPYNAAFTQSVQKQGGIAPAGRTDVALLNAKFDQVHPPQTGTPGTGRGAAAGRPPDGGIYQFMTHPSLLDFGPEQFFEKHLAYIAGRPDVWYVPTGPLYAYQIVRENTVVTPLGPKDGWERFAVHHNLDPKIYDNAVTLTFAIPAAAKVEVRAGGKAVPDKTSKLTDRWNVEYARRDGNALLVTIRPNTVVELKETK